MMVLALLDRWGLRPDTRVWWRNDRHGNLQSLRSLSLQLRHPASLTRSLTCPRTYSLTRSLDAPNVAEDGVVLVHPTCGPTQADDIPGIVRYHTYEVLQKELNNDRVKWAFLPYSMHMAGPREAIQHMLIRKNYGCTHFIIGRDMAGCKSSLTGEDFYGAYDAQNMAMEHAKELGMDTVPSLNVVFTEEKGYITADVAEKEGLEVKKLSGTKFRQMLRGGEDIPEWFAFKSVVQVLRDHQKNAQ